MPETELADLLRRRVRWGPQSLTARAAWIERKEGNPIGSAAFRAFGSRAPSEYYDLVDAVQQRLTAARGSDSQRY